LQSLRVHLLDGGTALAAFGAGSKTNTQWTFLSRLHALGRTSAEHWLRTHGDAIGQRSSFDTASVLQA
jgi:NTE family protein